MRILLDTSALIELERQRPAAKRAMRKLRDEELYVSTVSATEFLVGFKRLGGSATQRGRAITHRFISLPFDQICAEETSTVAAARLARGVPVGFCDDALSGTMLAYELDLLITENVKHFSDIPGLKGKVKRFADIA